MWELQHEKGEDIKSNNELSHARNQFVFNILSHLRPIQSCKLER